MRPDDISSNLIHSKRCTFTSSHTDGGPVCTMQDYIGTLPAVDRAEAFGQHPNADIAYQIEDSWVVLESLLSLQPQTALPPGAKSREETVGAICADLLDQVSITSLLSDVQQASQMCHWLLPTRFLSIQGV